MGLQLTDPELLKGGISVYILLSKDIFNHYKTKKNIPEEELFY